MNYIFLNLKRFDVPPEFGGINHVAPIADWGGSIVRSVQDKLSLYAPSTAEFTLFFPEAHILSAAAARHKHSAVQLGCQSVYRENLCRSNAGTFTSNLPAAAAQAMGCGCTMIGHSEERRDKEGILAAADVVDPVAVNLILNKQLKAATEQGVRVLYCIGETAEERDNWEDTLAMQLELGLDGVDLKMVTLAYEPLWGTTPPDRDCIQRVAQFLKESTGGMPLVYGDLRMDNAALLSGIPELDGGLISLTHPGNEAGFAPDEYLQIVGVYLGNGR